jgi:hypothetical protein
MAKAFTVEFSVAQAPEDAQSRAPTALKSAAAKVGLRLKNSGTRELVYAPSYGFPFLVNLWRHLDRQQMTVRFEPAEHGASKITISGTVAGSKQTLAADSEFWAKAFAGGSAA